MFGLMKKHVLRAIDGTRWASRETKREAEAKIDNLHGSFVGTDLFFNYTFLQNRYGQVDITSDFFTNVLQMFKHFRQNIYHFVNAQVDKDTYTWNLISYPFTVNAFHLQQLNSIGKKLLVFSSIDLPDQLKISNTWILDLFCQEKNHLSDYCARMAGV